METYKGGCHCGRVRYEVTLDVTQSITCNCSSCKKRGSILSFTGLDQFKLLKGEAEVTEYLWHKKIIHYYFCKTCGVMSYAQGATPDGNKMMAINVRCLDGIDLDTLKPVAVDGASF